MNFILFGSQEPRIKTKIKKLEQERLDEINDLNTVKYDFLKDELEDIISDITYLPLGVEKKIIIIENATFLLISGDKKILDRFYDVIPKNDEFIEIILSVYSNDIDKKSKLYKLIEENGQIIEYKEIDKKDWPIFVNKYFNDRKYRIDKEAVNELINRTEYNLSNFLNEANKLMLYKSENIDLIDVTTLVSRPIEDDVFQLSNALFRKDNAAALEIFRDLKLLGNKATDSLIPMLSNQFRLVNEVRFLANKQYDINEIVNILKIKSIYRVKIALENSKKLSYRHIANALDDLYKLDYNIKSGRIDRFTGFELFLINFPN